MAFEGAPSRLMVRAENLTPLSEAGGGGDAAGGGKFFQRKNSHYLLVLLLDAIGGIEGLNNLRIVPMKVNKEF